MSRLPPYTLKVSSRAHSVRLNLSLAHGLVVTIPRGFDERQVPELIQKKLPWIEESLAKLEQEREKRPVQPAIPAAIDLPVVHEHWKVQRIPEPGVWLRMKVSPASTLILNGPVDDPDLVHQLLKRWLHDRAKTILEPRLEELSKKMGMPYSRLMIRDQRTRWGSCSTTGTISLNQRLLLLPEPLITYVIVHELCHTVVHSHSPQFWALVGQYLPDYKSRRVSLHQAAASMPDFWLRG